jgi:hypothetical protein
MNTDAQQESWLRKNYAKREQAALSIRLLGLADYCNADAPEWPTGGELHLIDQNVIEILRLTHQRVLRQPFLEGPALWKLFQLLNKRVPALRLVQRVNKLLNRARDRLSEAPETGLMVLLTQAMAGEEQAQNLLRDINFVRGDISAAANIVWSEHEPVLAQLSLARTRSVEPACSQGNVAPVEVRCYARTIELIVDNLWREELRRESVHLLIWAAAIEHPLASELLRFDRVASPVINKRIVEGLKNAKIRRKRGQGSARQKRFRAKKSLPE